MWLRFLISQQFLSGLFELLEQSSMIPCLIDRRLEFFAQLGQPFEPLLVREILVERVFHPHRRVIAGPLVTALINIGEMEQTPYRKLPGNNRTRRHPPQLLLHCK